PLVRMPSLRRKDFTFARNSPDWRAPGERTRGRGLGCESAWWTALTAVTVGFAHWREKVRGGRREGSANKSDGLGARLRFSAAAKSIAVSKKAGWGECSGVDTLVVRPFSPFSFLAVLTLSYF